MDDGCTAEFDGLTLSRTENGGTRLVPRFDGNVTIDVVADDVVGGSARVQVGSNGLVSSTGFGVTGVEPTGAEAVVSDVSTGREVARMSLAHVPIPTCP